ncbi:ser/Thr protein phosphatase family protein [Podospora didyma]|uniref:Ser/Thr protein phosphatase family protein n=1 Tax=Podospora didyma TaxID=330526 RepID=A0AAE0NU50_9PEZI|nr:ser/Thr protein phosphatase family protein [Podospora didyma]
MGSIKTRFLVLSDTHGKEFTPEATPQLDAVDVVIHCGDLTEASTMDEFRTALGILKKINACLKLSDEAGSSDCSRVCTENLETPGNFFDQAASKGIVFLDEGIHHFNLQNGAVLTVYASPYTPSMRDSGFQFRPENGHKSQMEKPVDVAITHGPPRGILDMTESGERAGCPGLFAATAQCRPRMHCFGHIHKGWGAELITWRDPPNQVPSLSADINHEQSVILETLSTVWSQTGEPREIPNRHQQLEDRATLRVCQTSHCMGDKTPLNPGQQTLFVNAAIQGLEEHETTHLPWVVDIELPRAQSP